VAEVIKNIVEEIDGKVRECSEWQTPEDAGLALQHLGEVVERHWPALRSALSPAQPQPQGAAGYERESTEAWRSTVRDGVGRAATQAAVARDLDKCESALSSVQARVAELEREVQRLKDMLDEDAERITKVSTIFGERAALAREIDAVHAKLNAMGVPNTETDPPRLLSIVERLVHVVTVEHANKVGENVERGLMAALDECAAERDRERAARELTEAERETFKQGWQGAEDRISELHRERDQERAAMRERVKDLMPAVIVVEALHIQDQRQPYRELSPEMRDELPKAVAGLRAFFSALPAAPAIAPPPAEQETPQ
jgi:predicted nuclease with TOPRIM domain